MPLTKAKGNMYDWVTHTHTHLAGECPHKCSYCYVQAMARRFKSDRYQGPLRLVEAELAVNYGHGKTIFVEHCNDMFADDVHYCMVAAILAHCRQYPENMYVFQTKNPLGYMDWREALPPNRLLGCTIETTDMLVAESMSQAPAPHLRAFAMQTIRNYGERTFITIEPILCGDMELLASWCAMCDPRFVNIGADSKGTGLPEPTPQQVRQLVDELQRLNVTVRQKRNLGRLLKEGG